MNLPKLTELLQSFYEISGMDIAIISHENKILARRYSDTRFCACVQKSERCMQICLDSDAYRLSSADMEDGRLFCALINIGLDPIEKLEICIDFDPKSIHALTPNGEEKSVFFVKKNDRYILDISANTLDPVVLFIER